ncbi:MAG: hypothetical protein AAFQ66_13820 [Pseudomonadota bacterium]
MKYLLIPFAMVIVALVVVSFGAPHMRAVQGGKAALQGASVTLAERCIGAPALTERHGDQTVLTFTSAQQRGDDGRTLPTQGAADAPQACVFRLATTEGVITHVTSENRAGWGGGSITRCAAIVRGCID